MVQADRGQHRYFRIQQPSYAAAEAWARTQGLPVLSIRRLPAQLQGNFNAKELSFAPIYARPRPAPDATPEERAHPHPGLQLVEVDTWTWEVKCVRPAGSWAAVPPPEALFQIQEPA